METASNGGCAGNQTPQRDLSGARAPSVAAERYATGMPVLLTDEQAAACLGVSVRKFHDLRKTESWLPKAVVLGPRLLRWPRTELEAAVANMPRQESPGAEPPQLARRRRIEAMKAGGVPA